MSILERAQREGTPLIEGDQVTFVWQGANPPLLVGDFTDWWRGTPVTLATQSQPGVWTHTITLPADAYIEYAWVRTPRTEDVEEVREADPLNKRSIWNGIDADNHWFGMPGYVATPYTRYKRGVARGKVTKYTLYNPDLPLNKRDVWLYRPPVDHAVPLMVVWDGRDYLERARLNVIVDRLIAEDKIQPVALAFIDNAGPLRFFEYLLGEAILTWVHTAVIPLAHQHLDLTDPSAQPGSWGVAGASMGGLMALYTGMRLPHIFGRVISQSGAFHMDIAGRRNFLDEIVRRGKKRRLIIWQDVGTMEWLLPANRRMNNLLRKRRYRVTYREYNGGHNYARWGDQLADALIAVYGVDVKLKAKKTKRRLDLNDIPF